MSKRSAGRRGRSTIWLQFTGIVFATILIVFTAVTLVWFLLFKFNVISADPHGRRAPLFLFLIGSVLLGSAFTAYIGKVMIRPIQNIGDACRRISEGDFSVRVPENGEIAEMREIARRFNAMTHDLANIETLRTDFVANVSHEIKTPLSSIEGYATLLQTPGLSDERRERYTEKIIESSRRLSELAGNMLWLSKLENQELVLDNKNFRLDEQIRRAILLLEVHWSEKDIRFELDLPRVICYGSEQLIEMIWSNLVGNAVKFSPAGGVVDIRLTETENGITVRIADEGVGMSDEVMRHIFEKFYQGDTSRRSEGNGLGLPLVKRITEICGGSVDVESTPGAGSVFTVKLPIKKL